MSRNFKVKYTGTLRSHNRVEGKNHDEYITTLIDRMKYSCHDNKKYLSSDEFYKRFYGSQYVFEDNADLPPVTNMFFTNKTIKEIDRLRKMIGSKGRSRVGFIRYLIDTYDFRNQSKSEHDRRLLVARRSYK